MAFAAVCFDLYETLVTEFDPAWRPGLVAYRATWFLDRWPAWRRAPPDRGGAAAFPALRALDELFGVVAGARGAGP